MKGAYPTSAISRRRTRRRLPGVTNSRLGITPNVPGVTMPPPFAISASGFSILGVINNGTYSVTNQTQVADQISISHGRHIHARRLRMGTETTGPSSGPESAGTLPSGTLTICWSADPRTPRRDSPATSTSACSAHAARPQGIIHGYNAAGGSAYFQDDFKATSRLTFNLGVRWEYNGALTDKYGNLTQIWVSRIQAVPLPPSGPTTSGPGVSQWVVPSNFISHYRSAAGRLLGQLEQLTPSA